MLCVQACGLLPATAVAILVLSGPVVSLLVAGAILAWPGSYARHRTRLLVAARLLRMLSLFSEVRQKGTVLAPPAEDGRQMAVHLAAKVGGERGAARACSRMRARLPRRRLSARSASSLCRAAPVGRRVMQTRRRRAPAAPLAVQPCILLVSALGFALPLRWFFAIQPLGLLWGLWSLPGRCALECTRPANLAFYERVARFLAGAMAQLPGLRPLLATKGSAAVTAAAAAAGAAQPPGAACVQVQAFLMLVLGFLLPALILDRSLAAWRGAWKLSGGPGRPVHELPLSPLPAAHMALQKAGLLAVGSVLSWSAAELALQWAWPRSS